MTTFAARVRRLKVGAAAQTAPAETVGRVLIWRRADDFGVYYHANGARYDDEVATAATADEALTIAATYAEIE